MKKRVLLLLAVAACHSDPLLTGLLPLTDGAVCVALGADYRNNVGVFSIIGLPSMTKLTNVLRSSVRGDAVLRTYGGRLFVINRTINNVTVIGPADDALGWRVESQFSTGPSTNPQDIAVVGDKAYVTLYNSGDVLVFDLTQPTAPIARVDVSGFDPDGVPEANSVAVLGSRVLVTLDLLDWSGTFPVPRGNGKVVIIDPARDAVDGELELGYSNPYGFMFPWRDGLVVASVADYSGVSGCLHALAMDPSPAQHCLAENAALGGTVSAIAVGPAETYVAVSSFDAEFNQIARLRRLDADGVLQPGSITPDDQLPTDVAYSPTGHLVYHDAAVGGLRVYDLAAGRELTAGAPISIGLSPVFANGIVCVAR